MLCVQLDPGLRPGSTQLLKHPFIQSIRKGSVANWLEYLTLISIPTIQNLPKSPTIENEPTFNSAQLESATFTHDDKEDQRLSRDSIAWDFYD
jgi:hypothetical protein